MLVEGFVITKVKQSETNIRKQTFWCVHKHMCTHPPTHTHRRLELTIIKITFEIYGDIVSFLCFVSRNAVLL